MAKRIDFQTEPARYRHWKLKFDGEVAELLMDVDENAGLFDGYQLKLNSYDLGVDIELADAVQRLRFEHPEVKTVVLKSGKDRVFCAGANIRMLAGSTHAHKVNFCKFTNETRNSMEDASANSGQKYLCAIRGTAAGGGYELALATDHIILADDGSSTVSLPELPLLAVLPGTGGLTRVTDKRKVRRDLADAFCTVEEGVRGTRAVKWRLVDQSVPNSKFDQAVKDTAKKLAAQIGSAGQRQGHRSSRRCERKIDADAVTYSSVRVGYRSRNAAGDDHDPGTRRSAARLRRGDAASRAPRSGRCVSRASSTMPSCICASTRPTSACWIFKSQGEPAQVLAYDAFLDANKGHWLAREILHYWKRVLKRVDVTSRSLVALVEPGSCFAGTLAEIVFACDRSFMLVGALQGDNRPPATITLSALNFGAYPMSNDHLAVGHALSRRARERRSAPRPIWANRSKPKTARSWDWSRPRSTTSTGTTRCASSWRSARASPPTASPAWRRTCASPARRPWKRRSSAASRPGRTGSSSDPMRPAPRARSSATAAA